MAAGRKRAFDKDTALDLAMRVFWENGYAGTSVSDLTAAMGINKPSLYAAFGNKEALFITALEHYLVHYQGPVLKRLTDTPEQPFVVRLKHFLQGVVALVTNAKCPKGCMLVKSCDESGGAAIPHDIAATLDNTGDAHEQALEAVLEGERLRHQLPENVEVQPLTKYLMSVMYGLSVQARRGKTSEELNLVVDWVVDTFPKPV